MVCGADYINLRRKIGVFVRGGSDEPALDSRPDNRPTFLQINFQTQGFLGSDGDDGDWNI